ncbi:MAG TPA: low temperature requirement protein A [Baekduia sp.]|nr:low temperature requirement protein A [Baekduia sp.]
MTATAEAAIPSPPAAEARVTTLELFFDLVFVFTLTQLSAVLVHELSWAGLGHVALMLGLIFYIYGGYAWLTNALDVQRGSNRALLLAGMCGYFVIALAIPEAFSSTGTTFGLGYVAVVAVHSWLFAHTEGSGARAILRLAPSNFGGAALVVAGGVIGGTAQVVLWTLGIAVSWVVPRLLGDLDFEVVPAHFVERHGLVVIVAIGESIVAIGIGAADLAVDVELIVVAVLGVLLSAALWWTYFAGDDERAVAALAAMTPARRGRAALEGFGYAHLVLLLGIVCVAVGLKKATGHAYDELKAGEALALAGGVALFLAGDVWFRRVMRIGAGADVARVAGVLAALATIALGTEVAAVAQIAALVAVVAAASSVPSGVPQGDTRRHA